MMRQGKCVSRGVPVKAIFVSKNLNQREWDLSLMRCHLSQSSGLVSTLCFNISYICFYSSYIMFPTLRFVCWCIYSTCEHNPLRVVFISLWILLDSYSRLVLVRELWNSLSSYFKKFFHSLACALVGVHTIICYETLCLSWRKVKQFVVFRMWWYDFSHLKILFEWYM